MTAEEYIKSVNTQIQGLFETSLAENKSILDLGVDVSKSLQIWLEVIPDSRYKILLSNGIQSLELSLISQTYCIYRNAFSLLRLSLEMLFGGIYFSTNLLDFIEWTNSSKDLNWSTINDPNNGVLSPRFYNAFFSELKESSDSYLTKSKLLYRDLSEYVHGNHHTWITESEALKIDKSEIEQFERCLKSFQEISNFTLSLRFLKEFTSDNLEQVEPIVLQSLNHIIPITQFLSKTK
jgi:hypothetical protein